MKTAILILIVYSQFMLSCNSGSKSSKLATPAKPNAPLIETYWKLTEVMGEKVPPAKPGTREMHLVLKKTDNRLNAFAGCNTLSGTYELGEGYQLHFLNVISTLMACPNMTIEESMKKALGMTDNYSILGDSLSLNKARMAPLARFVAVNL